MRILLSSTIVRVLAAGLLVSAAATADDDVFDGPDRQSPAEIEAARRRIEAEFSDAVQVESLGWRDRERILRQYRHLDRGREVPRDLLEDAILYFDANKTKFPNSSHITIVDFGPRSDKYRFFMVDLQTGSVEKYRTTHGRGSDQNADGWAESFGNVPNSHKSSLGFVRVAEVYSGAYRRSVRLDGLSETNSRIRERAIVFHGWDHVTEEDRIQGMSRGCITMDWRFKDAVIDKIRDGSLMYVGVSEN